MQQWRACRRAVDLYLRHRLVLVSFHQYQVARREALKQVWQCRLRGASQLVHQAPARGGADQDFGRAGMAVAMGIFSRLVNVEVVVGVFDDRYLDAASDQQRDQIFDQRGLAVARICSEAKDFQGGEVVNKPLFCD